VRRRPRRLMPDRRFGADGLDELTLVAVREPEQRDGVRHPLDVLGLVVTLAGRPRPSASGSSGRSCGSGRGPVATRTSSDGAERATIVAPCPVSSRTSRSAACSGVSPSSTPPFGSVQRGCPDMLRCTMSSTQRVPSGRSSTTTPPAETTSLLGRMPCDRA
jgi:hypothetical protein